MTRMKHLFILAVVMVALTLSSSAAGISASRSEPTRPLSEAEIFVELNDTDGDLGLHASIDGEPWTRLEIEGPQERTLLEIFSRGRLKSQGLTQLFIESAEPPFDELSPAEFFRRFPEGRYEIEALAQDGGELEATAMLSHVLAARPANILVGGVPAAENCDAVPLPFVSSPVVIRWDPVTMSHPEIGKSGPVTISMYQFFVERPGVKLSVDLPPTVTEFEVPASILALGADFKFEIIARTSTGNNTAIETCFEVAP